MKRLGSVCVVLAIALALAGCGGGASSSGGGFQSGQGAVFVTGEDAPLPSVVAFNITLDTVTLNNSSGSVQVLTQPTTVDFARLVGMRSLLGFNTVAPGTYTSATITMASPVISYLNIGTKLFQEYQVTYDLENGRIGFTPYAVPEPGTWALLALGAALGGVYWLRRAKAPAAG